MAELFTMNTSLNEILDNTRVNKKLNYMFSDWYYKDIRPMFRKMKLKNMVKLAKAGGENPFPAEGLLRCANLIVDRRQKGELVSIPIWQGLSEEEMQAREKVVLVPFLNKNLKNAPAVIICPGGAYSRVSFYNEGIPVAQKLQEMGYQAFVLNYRLYPDLYPKPQEDLVRAIRFVRKNHEKLGVDPDNVMIMGFSAGGHLCATVGAMYDRYEDETHRYDDVSARPDKICLCYPVISLITDTHKRSVENLLGTFDDEERKRLLSAEMILSADYPKTFIWACEDDLSVPCSNSKIMDRTLENKKVPHMMKLYPTGGHGIGLGQGTSAQDWILEAIDFLK